MSAYARPIENMGLAESAVDNKQLIDVTHEPKCRNLRLFRPSVQILCKKGIRA
jgi:hypothetical protein